jgi:hypothetical protein
MRGMFQLRGHHLLCLLGFRGMGYSDVYAQEMTKIHAELCTNPSAKVQLVEGPDDLCQHFPSDQPYHCHEHTVQTRDRQISMILGLDVGKTYLWQDIEARIARHVEAGDIPRLCSTCPWLPYGVCEEGVDRIRRGQGLVAVVADNVE